MGLTSAMYTGLSGLNANQLRIDTIGDNIANVNTTAFKSSRSMFQTQFAQTLAAGTPPGNTSGGTNPTQIGLGSILGSIQRDFSSGSIETTGVATDCAIEGNGFFVTETPNGQQLFTRDGSFKLSSSNYLVTQDGSFVQGYGVDSDFNIVSGTLTNLSIPLGSMSTARATSTVQMQGNLMPTGDVGTQGTILFSQALEDGPGAPATADTLLTNLYDPAVSAVNPLFAAGDEITLTNVKRGDGKVDSATFTVAADSTLGDYLDFLTGKVGIDTSGTPDNNPGWWISDGTAPDPAAPTAGQAARALGVPPAGTIVIEGNIGWDNRLDMKTGAITSTNANNKTPLGFTIPNDATGDPFQANGESVHTKVTVYDSLGTPLSLDLVAVLESQSTGGNTWRFFASSSDDTDLSRALGNGTLTFNNYGTLKSVSGDQVQITRENTGAVTPVSIALDFSAVSGLANLGPESELRLDEQDGFAAGSLNSFSIGNDGTITGTFSNGLSRTLGQVVVATFANPEGLIAQTKNTYTVGPNSGVPVIGSPGSFGAGKILSGSLELSNVDLSKEFIGLITASTGFSAASRVISTSNDLLNQLLAVAR
jgi:flagellar hook protein FlgE